MGGVEDQDDIIGLGRKTGKAAEAVKCQKEKTEMRHCEMVRPRVSPNNATALNVLGKLTRV